MTIFLLRNVKLSVLLFLISTKKCTFAPVKLIIDIGNTVAKLVAFEGEDPIEEIKTSNETLAALPAFASKYHFDCGIVGSVIGIPGRDADKHAFSHPALYTRHAHPHL